MPTDSGPTSEFGDLLRLLEQGDPKARELLIEQAQEHLRRRVHQMLGGFPGVKKLHNTSDVLQEVLIDLHGILGKVAIKDSKHFLCLGAQHIRWKLIDLSRISPKTLAGVTVADEPSDWRWDPSLLAQWTEIHAYVENLPEEDRTLFDLLFYQEMPQEEAARIMGIPYRSLKRNWQGVRLRFMEKFDDQPFLKKIGPLV